MKKAKNIKKDALLRIGDITEKALAIICYTYFAYVHIIFFLSTWRVSSILIVILETLAIFMLLFRTPAKSLSLSFYDWVIAFGGFVSTTFFRPVLTGHDAMIYNIIQSVGLSITIAGILVLNKSFGLIAANRGVKTGGIYRFVRHPLYLGYFVSSAAYIVQNTSYPNLIVFAVFVLFQILRIIAEEDMLDHDPVYAEYKKKTPWRVIPLVW